MEARTPVPGAVCGASRAGPFLLLALLLAPGSALPFALAHEGEHGTMPDEGGLTAPAPDPGRAKREGYYTYYETAWLYGQNTVSLVGQQVIRMLAGDDEWLVWVDGEIGDVYAYNLAAGDGFYVTRDSSTQLYPKVDAGVVVWEDRRNGPADVFAYFLATGETRRVSVAGDASRSAQSPDIAYPWVVFEDDREGEWDVYAHDLETGAEIKLSQEGQRDQNAVIVGDVVVWRTYRFNVWDLVWYDLATGESGAVTSDRAMELPAFKTEEEMLFLQESPQGWRLHRFDPLERETRDTEEILSTNSMPTASGNLLVYASFEGARASFAALNFTSGYASRVTGYIRVMDLPVLLGRTLWVPVWNGTNAALLAYTVSDYATMRPPRLTIDTPAADALLRAPTRVRGQLTYESGWGDPEIFAFSLSGQNLTSITPGPRWSFTIDPFDLKPGAYDLVIEAHWKEAAPLVQQIRVIVPQSVQGTDIEREGRAFHFARVYGLYYAWIKSNPAILFLVALVLLGLALWFVRYRIRTRPARKAAVEYVRQPNE